jgi:hypothetical protein
LSAATLAPRELPQRLKLGIFSGLSSGIGLPFLWILSFGKAKESISPRAKALLRGAAAKLEKIIKKLKNTKAKMTFEQSRQQDQIRESIPQDMSAPDS